MRKKKIRFPVWMIAAVFLFTLALQTSGPVFAAAAPSPSLEVVSYTVLKGGSVYTGPIVKGDVVTIRLSIFDGRINSTDYAGQTPVPSATLNTPSFTIPSQANITVLNPPGVTVDGNGCTYTLQFANMTYTGTPDTFACNISYTGLSPPLPMQNVSITLSQLVQYVPPAPPDPGPPPDPPVLIPTNFILKDANYGNYGVVYAGEQFFLSLVILATNGSTAVNNVTASFSPPEQLTLADGSSVVYIGTMSPGSSTMVSAMLLASANIPEGSYTVGVDVTGVNPQTGEQIMAHMTVTIPVLQPERFEIFEARLPSDLTAGIDDGMGFSTVTLVNKGKGTVGNVLIEIVGNGLFAEEGRQYLGNVAGGEQKMADFILHADTPGLIDAKVVVTYENVRGEQKTLEWPFTVNVNEPWFEDPGWGEDIFPPVEDPVSTGPPMWVWLIIIAAAAVAVSVLLVRRHRKKKEEAEAALDDDDDDDDI